MWKLDEQAEEGCRMPEFSPVKIGSEVLLSFYLRMVLFKILTESASIYFLIHKITECKLNRVGFTLI